MNQRPYRVEVRWMHRRDGRQMWSGRATASSIRRAINAALEIFFTEKNTEARTSGRKFHLDAHTHIRVEAWRIT